jgi:RHS repeat-associated protein
MNPSLVMSNSFMWGSDLSGSIQGAGGVGGLLKVAYYGAATTNCFVAYDGNGNVSALINAADGTTSANYEYGSFGEVIRATGPMAKLNPFRFSTKYDDDESDFLYYGYRCYNPSTGRWLGRDPLQELGAQTQITNMCGSDTVLPDGNLYGYVANSSVNDFDCLGLVDLKFGVTYGGFLDFWNGIQKFSYGWGQPGWAADGGFSIGSSTTRSWVIVNSGLNGNTCNTINSGNSGAITLFLRDCSSPGTYRVTVHVHVVLKGRGRNGQASGNIYNAGPNKVLWSGVGTAKSPLSLTTSFQFDTYVGSSWTKAVIYTPTIDFIAGTGPYRPKSYGQAYGSIHFVSATRIGK